jgi:iduronate 2-sulfatase
MGDSEPAQYYTQHGYEKPWTADREQAQEMLLGYYAAISYVDAQMGRLIDALKADGLYDDTIVVVVSDHGFHTGEHGYWGKHNLWDRSLHVPLLIKAPDIDGGARNRGLTEHVDLYPTLCELAGLPVPDFLQGRSLMPLMIDPEKSGKAAVLAHRKHQWHDRIQAYHIGHSLRTERFRYNRYLDDRADVITEELFDYEKDPEEAQNRATSGVYRQTVEELRQQLERSVENFGFG